MSASHSRTAIRGLISSFSRARLPQPQQARFTVRQAPSAASLSSFHNSFRPVFNPTVARTIKSHFSTATEQTNKDYHVVHIDASDDVLNITLQLPTTGRTVFPLKPTETVRELIEDIRAEDNTINTLLVRYADGLRVSHTTTIEDLLKSDFVIEINNVNYKVPVHEDVVGEAVPHNVVGVNDLRALMQRAYFDKLRVRLQSDPRHHMKYQEFFEWCKEYGLTESEAQNFLRALHYAGFVLHFSDNAELANVIFLHPSRVFSTVKDSLNLFYLKQSDLAKLEELRQLKSQVVPLDKVKQFVFAGALDLAADKYANAMMQLGFLGVSGMFFLIARMVWVYFNWDIMEPITYFVGLTTLIIGYTFFLFTRADYTYPEAKRRIANKRLRKLYLKANFNWAKWNNYQTRIQSLEKELGL